TARSDPQRPEDRPVQDTLDLIRDLGELREVALLERGAGPAAGNVDHADRAAYHFERRGHGRLRPGAVALFAPRRVGDALVDDERRTLLRHLSGDSLAETKPRGADHLRRETVREGDPELLGFLVHDHDRARVGLGLLHGEREHFAEEELTILGEGEGGADPVQARSAPFLVVAAVPGLDGLRRFRGRAYRLRGPISGEIFQRYEDSVGDARADEGR